MNDGSRSITRGARRAFPRLESLEGRALLSGVHAAAAGSAAFPLAAPGDNLISGPGKGFGYTSPEGARVQIELFGVGTIDSARLDAQGALDLEFSGTNEQSGIVGTVKGGPGTAQLGILQESNVPLSSLSGVGGTVINIVRMTGFNLVDNGAINLTSGVHSLYLGSIGSNTQVNVRELPAAVLQAPANAVAAAANLPVATVPVTIPSSVTENGQTLSYSSGPSGAVTLTGVSGQFTPGPNLVATKPYSPVTGSAPGAPPAPAGVVISINHVNGPNRALGIGDAQIFGYDPVANTLTRFDVVPGSGGNQTGTPVLTIQNAIPTGAVANAGAALANDNGALVLLVDNGQNVYAYDPNSGSALGSFSLSDLTSGASAIFSPSAPPTSLGTFDGNTVIGNATGGVNGLGRLVALDVATSLQDHVAVVLNGSQPYDSTRDFGYSGGFTGVPGMNSLYAVGGAFLDTAQPNQTQRGVASLSPSGNALSGISFREASRTAITNQGKTINTTTHGADSNTDATAFGALGLNPALDIGASGGVNTVALYSTPGFSMVGTLTLNGAPNALSALTQSYYPAVKGAAIVDVQGNTQSFRALDANGLVFNGEGNVNLVKIERASNTTILGFPFSHAQIPIRNGSTEILTTARSVGDRSGVTQVAHLTPSGPLSQT